MVTAPHPDFVEAGRIAAKVIEEVAREVRPRVKVLRICALAERRILEYVGKRGGIAFPCNVSINEEAAHYTSPRGDTKMFPEQGLVKIDIGAHVNGHISDTAVTVDLDGTFEKFVAAAKSSLDAAIDVVRPGIQVGEVGAEIEKTIKRHGLKPVHQLSGHQLKPWILHAGKNVPNVRIRRSAEMKVGETYAIEPFATNGNGTIRSGENAFIFSNNMSNKKKLDRLSVQIRNQTRQRFGTLPWASRWLRSQKVDTNTIIATLVKAGVVREYPILYEGRNGMVSQFEHSIFVGEDGAIVTTLRK
ncbi:MAG: type II methionyl aminopeptidase [Candidatus Thorarchaeota archaeon]|nr:type II methionyl aminopeptidase [Candidatus Thorarchaeota archaeon]